LGGRIRDKLCKWRLLWGRKGTGGSSRIHVEKIKRGPTAKGGREKRVLTAESSDTKLRIIKRLNLMVSQPFLYIYIYIYI
jgi:hypothetical protein